MLGLATECRALGICIIFNPTARGEKARKFLDQLEHRKGAWTLMPTTGPGSARLLAKAAVESGFETVVAAGGDGTLNEVLNGIADAPDGFRKARFLVLPLGTVNVFARELRLPSRIDDGLDAITAGIERLIDVGVAEFLCGGQAERRCFIQLAGAGFDARCIELLSWDLKKRMGPGAYLVAGARALGGEAANVTITSGPHRATGHLVLIGNGKLYGGAFPFLHKSDLQDGLLDAVVFQDVHWRGLPLHAWRFITRQMFKEGSTDYFQNSEFLLESDTRAPLQLDGDVVGELPAKLTILPKCLRVLVPKKAS